MSIIRFHVKILTASDTESRHDRYSNPVSRLRAQRSIAELLYHPYVVEM